MLMSSYVLSYAIVISLDQSWELNVRCATQMLDMLRISGNAAGVRKGSMQ